MAQVLHTGGNYRIERVGSVLVDVVWKRPDLSREEGARLAEEASALLVQLAADATLTSLILDLTDAPSTWGPRTNAALVAAVKAWGARRVAIVAPEAITRIGARDILRDAASEGRVTASRDAAFGFAVTGEGLDEENTGRIRVPPRPKRDTKF